MNNQHKQIDKIAGSVEEAITGHAVSRRWLLRNTANAAAGVLAVSTLGGGGGRVEAQALSTAASAHEEHHADKPAGYVHSLHGWDTI